jgi:hypothetical protein
MTHSCCTFRAECNRRVPEPILGKTRKIGGAVYPSIQRRKTADAVPASMAGASLPAVRSTAGDDGLGSFMATGCPSGRAPVWPSVASAEVAA